VIADTLGRLGLIAERGIYRAPGVWGDGGTLIESINPATAERLALVTAATSIEAGHAVDRGVAAFHAWRAVPAPRRGLAVRAIGESLRRHKGDLARLVTWEVGKIAAEAQGEVQEMIDIAEFAVGLSRQLSGPTLPSERPRHRLFEQWHPLGPVGVITAFNFPVAVWAWNAALAIVCGDPVVWKPAPEAPLCALAVDAIVRQAIRDGLGSDQFVNLISVLPGDAAVGAALAADERLPLISATGSTRMGREVAAVVARRLGRSLLELGGNNAAIVTPRADLDLAVRAIVFAAAGTAGQRCTTLRRLIVHESLADSLIGRLASAYRSLPIGDPADPKTLVGPLIRERSVEAMTAALRAVAEQGGSVICGGNRLDRPGYFIEPAIVRARPGMAIVAEETFAPILYVMTYRDLDEAIAIQNGVPQGLASSIFSDSVREAERFLSAEGSDCGIANVNIGPSGAEIGGAFGGEKSTGGGREAGSDSWKAYMRRQTCTVNDGSALPLAQGVRFDLGE